MTFAPRASGADCFATGSLSPRELDVLRLVSEGCRDREIAHRLFVSHHTVANHVRNILAKLDVQSRAAAVAHAARDGLI
jgi:DNA-binding CsgD family transcriptional regulator